MTLRIPFQNWQQRLLVLFCLFCLLPFVLLAIYAHPSADDWYMAGDTQDLGYWQANANFYKFMTGRFASSALLYLHPMLWSFTAFKVACMILVLSVAPSLRWAVGAWFPEASTAWKWQTALVITTLYLWGMASTAQGLYWGTGAADYTLPAVLYACLAGILGRSCLAPDWKPSKARLISAMLVGFFITGCTEVAMALLFMHVVALNGVFLFLNRRVSRPLLALLIAVCLGITIVMMSPGNSHRSSLYSNDIQHALLPSLLFSLKMGAIRLAGWFTLTPLLLLSLLFLSGSVPGLALPRTRAWQLVGVVLLLLAGTLVGGFFIGAWSMGKTIPPRAINLLGWFFLLDWFVFLTAVSSLLRHHQMTVPVLNPAAFALIFLTLTASLRGPGNVKIAWKDLLSGAAAAFDRENNARNKLIRESPEADMVLEPLKSRPRSLCFCDLTTDPTFWRNTSCAQFFHKKSLRIKE